MFQQHPFFWQRLRYIAFMVCTVMMSLTGLPTQAQVYDPNGSNTIADIPDPMNVTTNFGSALDVQTKVDGILRVKGGEIMDGLNDYQVAITDMLIDKLKDELVGMFASMMPTGSLAKTIITKYQKKKDESLAKAIDRVKAVSKNSLNKQLKTKYQDFKINYARMEAKWKTLPELKNSVADKLAQKEFDKLWGEHVKVLGEFYDDDVTHDKMKYLFPEINHNAPGNLVDHGYNAFAADVMVMDDAKAYKDLLTSISDKEYDNDKAVEGEMVAYSHYDRMMMKRAILERMRERVINIQAVASKVNRHVQGKVRQDQRSQLNTALGGKDSYRPLPVK